MVSKASDDLPDPDSPVMTTSASRGSATVMSLRLCSRAPETTSASDRAMEISVWNRTDVPPSVQPRTSAVSGRRRAGSGNAPGQHPLAERSLQVPRNRLALCAILAGLAFPASASAQTPLTACPTIAPGAQCGEIASPLDHTGAIPGTQRVGFTVLPSTGQRAGTLAVLVGGPGQAGTTVARQIATLLTLVRTNYDLLIVDQRGTGRSGALTCKSLTTGDSIKAVTSCGESLGVARNFLTSREDAADLEDVRAALGIDRLSLLGISYGTEIAGYYARLFPGNVDHMVLDSPEPIEGPDAMESLRQLALPRVLREVCWPPSCRSFLASNPITGVAALAAKLRKKPLRGYVVTPNGTRKTARMTSTALYALTAVS